MPDASTSGHGHSLALFEWRDPLGLEGLLREDERIIAKPYEISKECGLAVHGHRFSTPSGIS